MARILSGKSESRFAPSHSFLECTTFWRDTVETWRLQVIEVEACYETLVEG
jgi:hypothetical protein